ncbi:hypothetical protein EV702DRAFT_1051498 [Suillus placidus]|uniref:Uncharacterized protein n=1 Tax=Suillus placidus TaxID=48579 RepID=A0A9P6ZFN1_9AGAM|nr:hypothetical protein EV702DRAFT_1051498 [Suillus placidus]
MSGRPSSSCLPIKNSQEMALEPNHQSHITQSSEPFFTVKWTHDHIKNIVQQINSNIFDGVIKAQSDDTPGTTVEDITDSLDCVMATLDNDNDSDGASLYAEPHVEIKTHHKSPAVLTVSLPSKPPAPQTFTALAIHNDPSAPSVSTWSLPTAMTSHAAASVEGIPKDLSADTGTSNTKVQKKAARGKRTKAPVNDTDVCHSSSNTTAK